MRDVFREVISRWVPDGQSLPGRMLRWPLRAIPEDAVFPILTGPNRGFRWISGATVHGCWVGSYEKDIADRLWSRLSPGDVFYDAGAHVGYYTLLGSRAVGSDGRVIAFEPLPRNLSYLRRHLALNEITNVDVVPAALRDRDGEVTLASEDGPSKAKMSAGGSLSVSGRTMDSLPLLPPDVVKMDVEGAEAEVLRGGLETLGEHRPLIIFSTHGAELRSECYELLESIGYRVTPLRNQESDHIAEVV